MSLQLEMGLSAAHPNRCLVADDIARAAKWIASTAQRPVKSGRPAPSVRLTFPKAAQLAAPVKTASRLTALRLDKASSVAFGKVAAQAKPPWRL
jgi:hypothetical protein